MFRTPSPIDNYTFKPGLKVKVIDITNGCNEYSFLGEEGIIVSNGCHPDTREPVGWVIKFPFRWSLFRFLTWHTEHFFEHQLELME